MPESRHPVLTFDTADEMIDWLRKERAEHDRISAEQDVPSMIRAFHWFVRRVDDLIIIGRKADVCDKPRGLTQGEWDHDLAHAKAMEDRGYIFGEWFSKACPEGEYGSAPGECCSPITKEGFDAALAGIQGRLA